MGMLTRRRWFSTAGAFALAVAGIVGGAGGDQLAGAATTCDVFDGGTLTTPTAVSLDPVPIAAPGTLAPSGWVAVTVRATDASGNCVSGGTIHLSFTGPGAVYPSQAARCQYGLTSLSSTWAECFTDSAGTVPLVYVAASPLPNGGVSILKATAFISAVAPPSTTYTYGSITVSPIAIKPVEGTPFSGVVASVRGSKISNLGSFSSTIDWRDGGTSQGTLVPVPDGTYQVVGTHLYTEAAGGDGYKTTVTVSSLSGPSAVGTGLALVADAPLTAVRTSLSGKARRTISGVVATFSDGNIYATADQFTASIAWGDGTSSSGSISTASGGFAVQGTHRYSKRGTYAVTVTIHDRDGATAIANGTASIRP